MIQDRISEHCSSLLAMEILFAGSLATPIKNLSARECAAGDRSVGYEDIFLPVCYSPGPQLAGLGGSEKVI